MDALNLVFGIAYITAGVVFFLLGWPLTRRRIPMNGWYGARFPESFKSREAWYDINEYGGRLLMRWALVMVVIGVIALFMPFSRAGEWLALVFAFLPLSVVAPAVWTYLYARKYAATH